jgi:hypothetical protein
MYVCLPFYRVSLSLSLSLFIYHFMFSHIFSLLFNPSHDCTFYLSHFSFWSCLISCFFIFSLSLLITSFFLSLSLCLYLSLSLYFSNLHSLIFFFHFFLCKIVYQKLLKNGCSHFCQSISSFLPFFVLVQPWKSFFIPLNHRYLRKVDSLRHIQSSWR